MVKTEVKEVVLVEEMEMVVVAEMMVMIKTVNIVVVVVGDGQSQDSEQKIDRAIEKVARVMVVVIQKIAVAVGGLKRQ